MSCAAYIGAAAGIIGNLRAGDDDDDRGRRPPKPEPPAPPSGADIARRFVKTPIYEAPAAPYSSVAAELGLITSGSIATPDPPSFSGGGGDFSGGGASGSW